MDAVRRAIALGASNTAAFHARVLAEAVRPYMLPSRFDRERAAEVRSSVYRLRHAGRWSGCPECGKPVSPIEALEQWHAIDDRIL